MPRLKPPAELEDRLTALLEGAAPAGLDPRALDRFGDFLATFWVEPGQNGHKQSVPTLESEGGWSPVEEQRLTDAGATRARLAPFVLRIEPAAEAACAIAAHSVQRPLAPPHGQSGGSKPPPKQPVRSLPTSLSSP